MAYLSKISSVLLCAQYQGSQIVDSYLEDPVSSLRFHAVSLDGVVSIHLGVLDGEPWYRWIWMWETTQEADSALNKLPPGFDDALEAVVVSIRIFLHATRAADGPDMRLCKFDLTPHLASLGLELAAVEMSKEEAAREFAQYQRLAGDRGKSP